MLQCYIRIILCHILHYTSPESGRIKNIGFIYTCNLISSLTCDFKCFNGNTADLILIIRKSIYRCADSILLSSLSCSEIKTSCKLSYDDHVKTISDDLITERACITKLIVKISRTKICKQVQRLTDCKKTCLRTFGRLQLIPRGCLGITANGTHQYCIRSFCLGNGFLCKRYSVSINGCPS